MSLFADDYDMRVILLFITVLDINKIKS